MAESQTVSNSKKGGWNAAVFIIVVEVAERFSFYGLSSNLITFLMGELGQSTATAAKNVNTWFGVSCIFPVVGAFVADSYLGRFKTVLFSSFIYLMGMAMLPISVTVVPPESRRQVFFTALYIIAFGEGGHLPCVQTFAADQFDEDNPEDEATKSSFFNWWYLASVAAGTTSLLVVIYIQDEVSWGIGFGILTGVVAAGVTLFMTCMKRYRKQIPIGSPLTSLAQVFVAALRKWRVSETPNRYGMCYGDADNEKEAGRPSQGKSLARTNEFRFLDKAATMDETDASSKTRNPWRLCPVNQVEETKLVLRLIPIWLSLLMFCSTIAQLNTFFTKQGSTMKRNIGKHFEIPPASFQAVVGLTILFFIPLYDRFLVPMARKITKRPSGITMLQRIGVGLFLGTLNMGISGVVERRRIRVAEERGMTEHPDTIVPMSIFWLLPQYALVGLGNAFAIVGMQELFYFQMPESMRSFGAAALIGAVGVGSFISNGIISAAQTLTENRGSKWLGDNLNKAHLDHYYYVIAALNALSLLVYVWISSRFVYKEVTNGDVGGEVIEEIDSDKRV